MNLVSKFVINNSVYGKPFIKTVFSQATAQELHAFVLDKLEEYGRTGNHAVHKILLVDRFIMVNLTNKTDGGQSVNVIGGDRKSGGVHLGFSVSAGSGENVHSLITDVEKNVLNDLCTWLANTEKLTENIPGLRTQ